MALAVMIGGRWGVDEEWVGLDEEWVGLGGGSMEGWWGVDGGLVGSRWGVGGESAPRSRLCRQIYYDVYLWDRSPTARPGPG